MVNKSQRFHSHQRSHYRRGNGYTPKPTYKGNTPLNQLTNLTSRDVFFDGPLGALSAEFTPNLSPIASGDFAALVGWDGRIPANDSIIQIIAGQIQQAHDAGVMTRYWDTPLYPIYARDAVWQTVLGQGSDLLNADDLEAAAEI
jgi:hypothetical protein